MFTGDGLGGSGDCLMSALHRAGFANMPTSHHFHNGLKLCDAFIAAVGRCVRPENKPTPQEIADCLLRLEAEIAAVDPPKDRRRVATRIQHLASEPRPAGTEKLAGQEKYRLRQGDYRVLYSTDDAQLAVVIVKIGHRRDVYR